MADLLEVVVWGVGFIIPFYLYFEKPWKNIKFPFRSNKTNKPTESLEERLKPFGTIDEAMMGSACTTQKKPLSASSRIRK